MEKMHGKFAITLERLALPVCYAMPGGPRYSTLLWVPASTPLAEAFRKSTTNVLPAANSSWIESGLRCVARGGEEIFVFQLFGALRRLCVYHPHSKDSAGKDLVNGEAVLAPQGHTVRHVQDGGDEKGDNFGASSSISALLRLRGRESRDRNGRSWPGPEGHNERHGGDVRNALTKILRGPAE